MEPHEEHRRGVPPARQDRGDRGALRVVESGRSPPALRRPVRGEIEDIAPQFFADLRSGSWQTEYVGTKVDLRISPLPRWDLYPNDRAVMGTIQTSRGCPFECEFCDVIEYVGRKQRHKPVEQVLTA